MRGVSERDTMKPRLKSSRAARELIKTHEPFLGEAARRGRRWVVGYGHTAAAKEGVRISRDDAELLMLYDVMQAEQAIAKAVGDDLAGPVRDALVSFACSIGAGAFQVSDVARLARDARHLEAAAALETWVRAEEDGRLVVSELLVRRRAAEKALYLQGVQDPSEAPVAVAPVPEPAPAAASEPAPVAETPADPAPRIGPLVDLELEFVDPPEPGGMVFVSETEEGESAEEELAEAETADEPVEDAAVEDETPAEAIIVEPQPAELTPANDPTGSVMARMSAQMAETLSVPAEDEAREEAPAASEGARLGFSFLSRDKAAETTSEKAAEAPAVLQDAPFKVGPVPVYGAIAATPAPVANAITAPVAAAPTPAITPEAPAPSAGFSGEVQAVGRPADMPEDEDEAADSEEIHPGVLAGSAAPAPELPQASPAPAQKKREPGNGNWMFIGNLAVGIAMTGFGLWTIIERGSSGGDVDFGLLGPVAAAMGVALTVTSAWILLSRAAEKRKRRRVSRWKRIGS